MIPNVTGSSKKCFSNNSCCVIASSKKSSSLSFSFTILCLFVSSKIPLIFMSFNFLDKSVNLRYGLSFVRNVSFNNILFNGTFSLFVFIQSLSSLSLIHFLEAEKIFEGEKI